MEFKEKKYLTSGERELPKPNGKNIIVHRRFMSWEDKGLMGKNGQGFERPNSTIRTQIKWQRNWGAEWKKSYQQLYGNWLGQA